VLSYGAFQKLFQKHDLRDCIVIVDEAHNIFNEQNNTKITIFFQQLFAKRSNARLFLMTATPMRNNPFEFFLVLKQFSDNQAELNNTLADKHSFYEQFLDNGKIKNEKKLLDFTRNKIHFFKHPSAFLFPNIFFNVKRLKMSETQSSVYSRIQLKPQNFYLLERQILNFSLEKFERAFYDKLEGVEK
jgi:Rad3-related DNA helicase